jgi:hypothetical protein
MHKVAIITSLLFFSFVLKTMGSRTENETLFTLSTHNLITGKYAAALAGYQKLEHIGNQTAALYNNMGAAYYNTQQWGNAGLYFEKAILLSPLDTQLIYNRNKVLAKFDSRVATNNAGFDNENVNYFKTTSRINIIAIACMLLSITLNIILSSGNVKQAKLFLKRGCRVLVAVSLIFIIALWFSLNNHQSVRFAIIVKPWSAVHLGPDMLASVDTYWSQGYKVELINKYKDWCEIKNYENKQGWVRYNDITEIK